jgi:hypothetical protein
VEEKTKISGSGERTLELKKISIRGVMVRGQLFSQNSVGAMMSREDTTLKSVAPRMSCAVLAAAAW